MLSDIEINPGESYDKEWALRDQGVTDGIIKGKEEKKIEMVRAMLIQGINIELVSKCSGLSIEEVAKIRETVEINPGESYDKELIREEQSRINEARRIASNMLKSDMDINLISKYTGLSIQEIKNI